VVELVAVVDVAFGSVDRLSAGTTASNPSGARPAQSSEWIAHLL
jgi:hypothetical protein